MSTDQENKSALLVVDVQQGPVDNMGFGIDYVNRVAKAIEIARNASITVIYVRMAYREGSPEANPNNRMLYNFAKTGAMLNTVPTSQIHSLIAPKPDDIVVIKSRVSAFKGSDLDLILRSLKIEHLILSGNATRMGIMATFFEAADNDYQLTVLSDCCTDYDQAVHNFLMKEVFPLQSNVVSLEAWTHQLAQPIDR